MQVNVPQSLLIIAVTAAVTFLTRLIPFIFFGGNKKIPPTIAYLGAILPPAVITILIIYCVRHVDFSSGHSVLPQIIAIAVTAGLHLWRKNNLISIGGGTVCYMLLIQLVFTG